jgi:hypothetical protein
MNNEQTYAEIEAQVGRGAGNIAATNFQHHSWLTEVVSDAARAMQLSLRSAWLLDEVWNNGTTVWVSPEGERRATVTAEGEVDIDVSRDSWD